MSKTGVDWMAVEKVLASQRVTHDTFEYAYARAKQLARRLTPDDSPVGLLIVGDSRVGKTEVLKALQEAYPKYRLDDGIRAPVLYIEAPTNPSVLAIAELILQKLGDPRAHVGTRPNRTMRVIQRLRDAQCSALLIDEAQHTVVHGGDRTKYGTTDFIKEVMDSVPVNLVLAGMPETRQLFTMNEQLRGRFSRPIRLKRFDWFNLEDKEQFLSILRQFRAMFPMLDMPALDDEPMAFRFYCASGGLIGYVYKILKQAIWNAVDAKNPQITLLDFECAHLQAVDDDRMDVSPFSSSFQLKAVPDLVKRAQDVGKHVEPPPSTPRKKRGGGNAPDSAHAALSV